MRRAVHRLVFAVACGVCVGCGAAPAPPTPTALPTPIRVLPTPTAPAPTSTPLPPATVSPTATATPPTATMPPGFELVPRSKPADVGQSYPFTVTLLCGVNPFVDFDGNLWDAVGPMFANPATATPLNPPVELAGTMTLLDSETALFAYPGGRIEFHRRRVPKIIQGFCGV